MTIWEIEKLPAPPYAHLRFYPICPGAKLKAKREKKKHTHSSVKRTHFSGEIARKCTVRYTTSEACTFVRMSLSLYEPHKVRLSVEQPLYLHHRAAASRPFQTERERKIVCRHCLCASLRIPLSSTLTLTRTIKKNEERWFMKVGLAWKVTWLRDSLLFL